ncbi:MAG: hypothetical protein DDG59_08840 [Anaerolineae bacterium]|jgi:HlyD family secretion protein|nr:MAG: hypothetical protein DDG59_08840 [Anaerolineae bacterium]
MKKKRYWIIILVLLLAAGGYFGYRWYSLRNAGQQAAVNIQTAQVQEGELSITLNATGTVRSAQSATLYWGTSGTVEKVYVQVGDTVQAGQKLAELAKNTLPQSVISAEADLMAAKKALEELYTNAEVAKATAMSEIATYAEAVRDAQYQLDYFIVPSEQANMSAMEALAVMEERLEAARKAFEPYRLSEYDNTTRQKLKEALDLAQADYDTAVKRLKYEYALQVAKANLAKAQQDYETYKDGPPPDEIAEAQAAITAAEAAMRLAWIEAPFAGVVTKAIPLVGDQVTSNTEAFRIDDLSTLYVDLSVSEVDINQIQIGQAVTITLDALRGKQFQGEVSAVAMVSDSTDYTVTVRLLDASDEVRPGMTSTAEILIQKTEKSLLVPNEAIRYENGNQVVYVVKPGEGVSAVTIQIGASSDSYSQVLSGDLQVGDTILLNTSDVSVARGFFPMMGGGFGGPPPGERRIIRQNTDGNSGGQP